MNPHRDGRADLRPLSDAEFYALSEREQLAYLTRILLEFDRLHLKQLRETEAEAADPGGTRH